MQASSVHEINENFYNRLYRRKNILVDIVYPFISFDQQSKSKANFFFVKQILRGKQIRVLDFGFGHGSFLLKFPKQCQLFGVDISTEAVTNFPRTAKALGRRVRTCTPDSIDRIIAPDSLDVICLSHVLEHVDDDCAILTDLSRFLDKDGYLLINVPINEVWKDPKHIRTYDLEKVKQLLAKAGFKLIDHLAFDKITAFLLEEEQNKKPAMLKKYCLRGLRLLLSFASFGMYKFLDSYVFKKYSNQQFLVLAKKA